MILYVNSWYIKYWYITLPFNLADHRAIATPYIAVLHVLFQREHNRIAKELAKLNPSWNNDKLYREAKKVNTAIYQHIIYNEYLTATVGDQLLQALDLAVKFDDNDPFIKKYIPTVIGGVTNEFTAAAFRLGHSMTSDKIM